MENLDLIILTIIVAVLYIGFAVTLFFAQNRQQHHHETEKPILK